MHTKSTPRPPRSPWWRHHRGQLAGGLLLLLVLGLGQGRTLSDYALHLERRWAQATTKALPSAPPRPAVQAVAPRARASYPTPEEMQVPLWLLLPGGTYDRRVTAPANRPAPTPPGGAQEEVFTSTSR